MKRILAFNALAFAGRPDFWDGLDSISPETDKRIDDDGGDDDFVTANEMGKHTSVGVDSALSSIDAISSGLHWGLGSAAFMGGAATESLPSESVDFSPESDASIGLESKAGLEPGTTALPTLLDFSVLSELDSDEDDDDDVGEVSDAETGDEDVATATYDMGTDIAEDAAEEEERVIVAVTTAGPSSRRKRLRMPDTSPRKRTARSEERLEVKAMGLDHHDKQICLEELVISLRDAPDRLVERVLKRNPQIDVAAVKLFRANLIARAQIPVEAHDLLMAGPAGTPEERENLIERATRALTESHAKRRGGAARAISEWMKYCIEPLRGYTGPESDICQRQRAKSRGGVLFVRLSPGQLKLFLDAELDTLVKNPVRKQQARRVIMSAKRVSIGDASSGVLPRPKSQTRARVVNKGGLSTLAKRICLEALIERPSMCRRDFLDTVIARVPHMDVQSIIIYYSNLIAKARVNSFVHNYLLARNTTEFHLFMVADINRIARQSGISVPRSGYLTTLQIWIKYCIRPLLADPLAAVPPCAVDRTARDVTAVHLSPSQRRALFTDILGSLRSDPRQEMPAAHEEGE